MSKHTDEWPKKLPRWTKDFPCPQEVTYYLAAYSARSSNRNYKVPPPIDWERILSDFHSGAPLNKKRKPYYKKS